MMSADRRNPVEIGNPPLGEQLTGASNTSRERRGRHDPRDFNVATFVGEKEKAVALVDSRNLFAKINPAGNNSRIHTPHPVPEQGGNGAETSSQRKLNLRPISAQQTVLGILSCVPSIGAVAIRTPGPPPTPSNDDNAPLDAA